jgi:hypothetical protein
MPDLTLPELLAGVGISFVHIGSNAEDITWATREFQRYAKLPCVAVGPKEEMNNDQPYAERLKPVPLPDDACFGGPIDGSLSDDLTTKLKLWMSRDYKIPVIVSAWKIKGKREHAKPVKCIHKNVWSYRQVTDTSYRMYVVDLSKQFTDLPASTDPNQWKVTLGTYAKYKQDKAHAGWGGPNSLNWGLVPSTYQTLTVSPIGDPATPSGKSRQATYRVVHGVAMAEVDGFLDKVNASD